MNTPEEVVAAAIAAINTEDWHGLTALCDPVSLRFFKQQTVTLLDDLSDGSDFLSETSRFDVADDFDTDYDFTRHLQFELANVSSLDEVKAMDPGRVFVRWLQARAFYRSSNDAEDANRSGATRAIVAYRYTVLGAVYDAPDIAHVLFRETISPDEAYPEAYARVMGATSEDERDYVAAMHQRGDPVVVACRRQKDGEWRIVAKRSFFLTDSIEIVELRRPGGT